MSFWMNAGVVLGVLAGALAFIGGVCAALVKAGRVARRLSRLLDEFLGHDDEPGLVERVDELAVEVKAVKVQVLPNGGSSLRDAVNEVRAELREHVRAVADRADSQREGAPDG